MVVFLNPCSRIWASRSALPCLEITFVARGGFRHLPAVRNTANKRRYRFQQAPSVAEFIARIAPDCEDQAILALVNERNIPPHQRTGTRLADGDVITLSPWYAHLNLLSPMRG